MGSVVNTVTSFLGGGSTTPDAARVDSAPFNLNKEAKPYQDFAEQQRADAVARSSAANANSNTLVQQLQAQAAGTAPSLAEAQLRSASDRSLAQQLAAAAAQRGGSPASLQRNLLRTQQATGRGLAQDSANARIQEQQSAQGQLGSLLTNQQSLSDNLTLQYMNAGYDYATATKRAQQQQALAQAGYDNAANIAAANNHTSLAGGLLGAGATIGGALLAGPVGAGVGASLAGGGGGAAAGSAAGAPRLSNGFAKGGRVIGPQKTKEKDTPKNDVIDAELSNLEIVLPTSVSTAKDAPEKAKQFVQKLIEKEKGKHNSGKKTSKESVAAVMKRKKAKKD